MTITLGRLKFTYYEICKVSCRLIFSAHDQIHFEYLEYYVIIQYYSSYPYHIVEKERSKCYGIYLTRQEEHFWHGIKDIWPFFINVTLLVKSLENDIKIFLPLSFLFENNVTTPVGLKKLKYDYVWSLALCDQERLETYQSRRYLLSLDIF